MCRMLSSNVWRGISVFAVVLAIGGAACAKVIYVDADASGADNGTSWENAYNYLQAALADANLAEKPVEVWVAQGVYTPDSNSAVPAGSGDREVSFQLVSGVTLMGGYAGSGEPDPNTRDIALYETTLSGDLDGDDAEVADACDLLTEPTRSENSHVVVVCGGSEATILDGFTIAGGNANAPGPYDPNAPFGNSGGGLFCEEKPTVSNCTFRANSALMGGAIYCWNGNGPNFTNNTIAGNAAAMSGGGICIGARSWPAIENNTIEGNSAWQDGGGVYCSNNEFLSVPLVINDNTIMGNIAGDNGGGIYVQIFWAQLDNNIITGNMAENGGGIWLEGSGDAAYPIVNNSTISGNRAVDMGGGICCRSYLFAWIENSILWGNTAPTGPEISVSDHAGAIVAFSDVAGGPDDAHIEEGSWLDWDGGNIDADPCFVDPGYWDPNGTAEDANDYFWVYGDYHLRWNSQCIDAGNPNFSDVPDQYDIDREPRVMAGRVDIGADEVGPKQADLSRDGLINFKDYSILILSFYSVPGDANWYVFSDLYEDDRIDYNDLALLLDDWLWKIETH